MISALSKLSKRQPIQELAFHKEQWEINGVPFVLTLSCRNATSHITRENCSMELI